MHHNYGISIDKLQDFIATPSHETTEWGSICKAITQDEYALEQRVVNAGSRLPLNIPANMECTLFVEEGEVSVGSTALKARGTIILTPGSSQVITGAGNAPSTLYLFFGTPDSNHTYNVPGTTSDYREKYWGDIQTIATGIYTAKRMLVKKGTNASLEFHCQKLENYYMHSGTLRLRLRAGRGEDRYFELSQGMTIFIPPGLMHQRGGQTDNVIIEISTHDEDSDSFLVEDGATKMMEGLPSPDA